MWWNRNEERLQTIEAYIREVDETFKLRHELDEKTWKKYDNFEARLDNVVDKIKSLETQLVQKIKDLEQFTMTAISLEQNKRIGLGERICKIEERFTDTQKLPIENYGPYNRFDNLEAALSDLREEIKSIKE